ncbi:MAG TPA: hypothetical protein VFQ65_04015 [Kofleriaceae bacterium]|nr:hypothetical protein [Kofleriaceae bacterium]
MLTSKLGLTFLALVSTTAVAAAQPAVTASTPADHAPAVYVEGGAMVGANDAYLTASAVLAGGLQLGDSPLWVHGQVVHGALGQLFGDGSGTLDQARLGLELRECTLSGIVCGIAGIDAGIQHTHFVGHADNLFDSTSSEPPMTTDRAAGIAVLRVGLDVGGKHLRYRPEIEMSYDGGANGVDLMQSLAWTF